MNTKSPNECHICLTTLGLRWFKHTCRNCNKSVCSAHSKTSVPLPHFGIMKEVRVCDTCARLVYQRRTGYRRSETNNIEGQDIKVVDTIDNNNNNNSNNNDKLNLNQNDNNTNILYNSKSNSSIKSENDLIINRENPGNSMDSLDSNHNKTNLKMNNNNNYLNHITENEEKKLEIKLKHNSHSNSNNHNIINDLTHNNTINNNTKDNFFVSGVLYNGIVEEQDNTMDDLLYLGTLKMGSRSLASRNLNANIAIWKERMLMLTPAEILCFKMSHDESLIGEMRTSVHMTDILHIEISEPYPRLLTIIRSDGRIFRLRAKTPEKCKEIFEIINKALHKFQDAMHNLTKNYNNDNKTDENKYVITCISYKKYLNSIEEMIEIFPSFHIDYKIKYKYTNETSIQFYILNSLNNNKYIGILKKNQLVDSIHNNTSISILLILHTNENNKKINNNNNHLELNLNIKRCITTYYKSKTIYFIIILCNGLLLSFIYTIYDLIRKLKLKKSYQIAICIINIHILILFWYIIYTTYKNEYYSFIINNISKNNNNKITSTILNEKDILKDSKDIKSNNNNNNNNNNIDIRFIEGCKGDLIEAKKRYDKTIEWRKINDIDNILIKPQKYFNIMKSVYTQYTHKRDKYGHPIVIEYAGNLKNSMNGFMSQNVTIDDAINHQIFCNEWLWKITDNRDYPDGQQLKILDIKGISLSDIGGEVFNFMKLCGTVIGDNNPERLYKVFILNPPSWFNVIWKLVSPLVNPKTREKTHVVRGQNEIAKALLEYIDPDKLPIKYGGTCICTNDNKSSCETQSPEEIELKEHVDKLNDSNYNEENIKEILQNKMKKPLNVPSSNGIIDN